MVCVTSGLEDVDGADDVLSADRTLAHALPAFCTRDHVTAFQQHAVDHRVHADTTQILIGLQPSAATLYTHTERENTHYVHATSSKAQRMRTHTRAHTRGDTS